MEVRSPEWKAAVEKIARKKHSFRHPLLLDAVLGDFADVVHTRCLICGWTRDITGEEIAAVRA